MNIETNDRGMCQFLASRTNITLLLWILLPLGTWQHAGDLVFNKYWVAQNVLLRADRSRNIIYVVRLNEKKRQKRKFKHHRLRNYNGMEFSDKKNSRPVLIIIDSDYYFRKQMARKTNATKKWTWHGKKHAHRNPTNVKNNILANTHWERIIYHIGLHNNSTQKNSCIQWLLIQHHKT